MMKKQLSTNRQGLRRQARAMLKREIHIHAHMYVLYYGRSISIPSTQRDGRLGEMVRRIAWME